MPPQCRQSSTSQQYPRPPVTSHTAITRGQIIQPTSQERAKRANNRLATSSVFGKQHRAWSVNEISLLLFFVMLSIFSICRPSAVEGPTLIPAFGTFDSLYPLATPLDPDFLGRRKLVEIIQIPSHHNDQLGLGIR